MRFARYAKESIDPTDPWPEMNGGPVLVPGREQPGPRQEVHPGPRPRTEDDKRGPEKVYPRPLPKEPGRILSAKEFAEKQKSNEEKEKSK